MRLGPNHKDGCDGSNSRYSGNGYNRVRVCACGAEDHAPEPKSLDDLAKAAEGIAALLAARDKEQER